MAAFAFVPRSGETRDADAVLREVWFLNAVPADALVFVLLGGIALLLLGSSLLLVSVLAVIEGKWAFVAVGPAIVLVVFPHMVVLSSAMRLGAWTLGDEVVTADGQRYAYLDSSGPQAQFVAIGKKQSSGLLYSSYAVYGMTGSDSSLNDALVVRPSPPKSGANGVIYITPDGRQLVGLQYDNNACYMVYDLASKRFYGYDEVKGFSPFLLLGEATPVHAPDVDSIVASLRRGEAGHGLTRQSLTDATTHPNPAVRTAAAAMLSAMQR